MSLMSAHRPLYFLERVETIHAFYGTMIGKKKGEAFHLKGILEIPDPVSHFTGLMDHAPAGNRLDKGLTNELEI